MVALVSDDILVNCSIADEYMNTLKIRRYTECDVITCADPNIMVARRYQGITGQDDNSYLLSRAEFILRIAMISRLNTLILGA